MTHLRALLAALILMTGIVPAIANTGSGPSPTPVSRFAVVIGNGAYDVAGELDNAVSDARAVARFLRAQGFWVEERYDLDRRGFEDLMRTILFHTDPDTEVVFYYAGHGIQIGRENYILPTDAQLASPYDTPFETLTLNSILRVIGGRSRLQLMILDSCRNNPFIGSELMTDLDTSLFETKSGFQAMSAPLNTLLSFSTSPGALALDGEGENSPFTAALVDIASVDPDSRLRDILDAVRRRVHDETEGEQVPWESSTLIEPFFFQSANRDPGQPRPGPAGRARFPLVQATNVTAGDTIRIEAALDRRIALGAAIARGMTLRSDQTYTLDGEVRHGRLSLTRRGVTRAYDGGRLTADELSSLVYVLGPASRHGTQSAEDLTLVEELPLQIGPAESGDGRIVEMTLSPRPCDRLAGTWLDPEGVGIGRYANEIDAEATIAACAGAVAEFPSVGRFHHQLARGYLASRDYARARAGFERARDLGHTRAWTALGTLINLTEAIEGGIDRRRRAPREALEHYATGVGLGDPYAYYALGRQYLRWGTSAAARRDGFDLLEQSITFGHTFAMNELGYFYLDKDSEFYEPDRALRYLNESAERQDVYGYYNLGLVYDRGLGDRAADPQQALAWYIKASDGLHPIAPVDIGRMYYRGRLDGGVNLGEAIRWYDLGLSRGGAWGGANAAWIIANKDPAGFDLADAGVRAAKTAILRNEGAAEQARKILADLPEREVNRAAQKIAAEFIPGLTIDGIIGPATRQAFADLSAEMGFDAPADDATERLLAMARVYWRKHPIRIDPL